MVPEDVANVMSMLRVLRHATLVDCKRVTCMVALDTTIMITKGPDSEHLMSLEEEWVWPVDVKVVSSVESSQCRLGRTT